MHGRSQIALASTVSVAFVALVAWYWFVLSAQPLITDYATRPAHGIDLTADECLKSRIVCIRINNASDFDFDAFDIGFPSQVEHFSPLRARATTSYRRVDCAYRYGSAEAYASSQRFVFQSTDFVGEECLRPGVYTYRYTAHLLERPSFVKDSVQHGELESSFQVDNHGI